MSKSIECHDKISLYLSENHCVDIRQDGYINGTQLCHAANKQFKHWNENKKSKAFINLISLSSGISRNNLIKYTNKITWVHPQIAMNIAKWISPEFDVKITQWIFKLSNEESSHTESSHTESSRTESSHTESNPSIIQTSINSFKRYVNINNFNEENVIYIAYVGTKDSIPHLKIGESSQLSKRIKCHSSDFDTFDLIHVTACPNSKIVEAKIKTHLRNIKTTWKTSKNLHTEIFTPTDAMSIDYIISFIDNLAQEHSKNKEYYLNELIRKDHELEISSMNQKIQTLKHENEIMKLKYENQIMKLEHEIELLNQNEN